MNWEAFAAVSTAFTGVVILATAVAAVREVRIAAEATQFEGALAVFAELDTPFQREARHFVQFQLDGCMNDPAFREEVALIAGADEDRHKELTVLRCFERLGMYVRKGFVDPDVVYMVASGRVILAWRALEEVVAIHRDIAGATFWENFEQLYNDCKGWQRSRGHNIDRLESSQVEGRHSLRHVTKI
jgi:hypothetical protein